MKKTITICIILLFISCSKNNDPFSDVEFGKITKREFIKSMKSQKVLIPDEKDTTRLRYFLNANGKKFPITVYINEERWLRTTAFILRTGLITVLNLFSSQRKLSTTLIMGNSSHQGY